MAYRAAPTLLDLAIAAELKLIDPHRVGDILQFVLAGVLELHIELATHLPVGIV